jgi:hypothetical protein
MPYGERVGIYLEDEPNNLLAEMDPEKANLVIELWNSEDEMFNKEYTKGFHDGYKDAVNDAKNGGDFNTNF